MPLQLALLQLCQLSLIDFIQSYTFMVSSGTTAMCTNGTDACIDMDRVPNHSLKHDGGMNVFFNIHGGV